MRQPGTSYALALLACCNSALADVYDVPPELWDRPRTAAAVTRQESIRRAMSEALAQPRAQIVIRHAPGQDPLLQAEELRSWLGALAIDTQRVGLQSDPAVGASLRIEVTP